MTPATFAVSEIFASIQGEGVHAGKPMLFLRLHGCPVGCPWCDTKYTWGAMGGEAEQEVGSFFEADGPSPKFVRMEINQITETLRRISHAAGEGMQWVCITGGEPGEQDIVELCGWLLDFTDWSIMIETSGTAEAVADVEGEVHVCVSPKDGMPGGKVVLNSVLQRANEIKCVVGKPADLDRVHALAKITGLERQSISLQPLSRSDKATAVCVEACKRYGYRLSLQLHAYLALR